MPLLAMPYASFSRASAVRDRSPDFVVSTEMPRRIVDDTTLNRCTRRYSGNGRARTECGPCLEELDQVLSRSTMKISVSPGLMAGVGLRSPYARCGGMVS